MLRIVNAAQTSHLGLRADGQLRDVQFVERPEVCIPTAIHAAPPLSEKEGTHQVADATTSAQKWTDTASNIRIIPSAIPAAPPSRLRGL